MTNPPTTLPTNPPAGELIILSSPSGGGKTTQRNLLLKHIPNAEFAVSYTTRRPRPEEVDGVDYHFLINRHVAEKINISYEHGNAKSDFQQYLNTGKLLEWDYFYGHFYGTPREQVENALKAGRTVIADVNYEGLQALRKFCADHRYKLTSIFITVPREELERRLIKRDIQDQENLSPERAAAIREGIDKRMQQADEILAESNHYDHVIESGATKQETFERIWKALGRDPIRETPQSTVQRGGAAIGLTDPSTKKAPHL